MSLWKQHELLSQQKLMRLPTAHNKSFYSTLDLKFTSWKCSLLYHQIKQILRNCFASEVTSEVSYKGSAFVIVPSASLGQKVKRGFLEPLSSFVNVMYRCLGISTRDIWLQTFRFGYFWAFRMLYLAVKWIGRSAFYLVC